MHVSGQSDHDKESGNSNESVESKTAKTPDGAKQTDTCNDVAARNSSDSINVHLEKIVILEPLNKKLRESPSPELVHKGIKDIIKNVLDLILPSTSGKKSSDHRSYESDVHPGVSDVKSCFQTHKRKVKSDYQDRQSKVNIKLLPEYIPTDNLSKLLIKGKDHCGKISVSRSLPVEFARTHKRFKRVESSRASLDMIKLMNMLENRGTESPVIIREDEGPASENTTVSSVPPASGVPRMTFREKLSALRSSERDWMLDNTGSPPPVFKRPICVCCLAPRLATLLTVITLVIISYLLFPYIMLDSLLDPALTNGFEYILFGGIAFCTLLAYSSTKLLVCMIKHVRTPVQCLITFQITFLYPSYILFTCLFLYFHIRDRFYVIKSWIFVFVLIIFIIAYPLNILTIYSYYKWSLVYGF